MRRWLCAGLSVGVLGFPGCDEAADSLFAVSVAVATPEGTSDSCYALRVVNGDGDLVWVKPDVCASRFGSVPGSTIQYIDVCDTTTPDNTVTVWLTKVEFEASVPEAERVFGNPCPVPTDAGADPASWTGGCSITGGCAEDTDTYVQFELDLALPNGSFTPGG